MSMPANSFKHAQDQFEGEYNRVRSVAKWKGIRAWARRVVAYGFKILAVMGGIAVAAGISKEAAQIVGIAIAVVVALDGIFSNHVRLLASVEAKHAYDR